MNSEVAMTLPEIAEASRRAQIAFCLGKYSSFEVALAREIEAYHNIFYEGDDE